MIAGTQFLLSRGDSIEWEIFVGTEIMRPTFQCLCGCYLAVWPSAIHFTSLGLSCPNLKNDGGGVSVSVNLFLFLCSSPDFS